MATLYKTDGTSEDVSPENGKNFQLEELYKLLNCTNVELIDINSDFTIMIGDGEARCKNEDCQVVNRSASLVYRLGWVTEVENVNDLPLIIGDVIVCQSNQFK